MRLLFVYILLFFSFGCANNIEEEKKKIISLIKEKTDIELSEDFEIMRNEHYNTEGAFDSDCTYYLVIRFDKKGIEKICKTIRKTEYFVCGGIDLYDYQEIMDKVNQEDKKGLWQCYKDGYVYKHREKEHYSEPFTLFLDTSMREITFELIHL